MTVFKVSQLYRNKTDHRLVDNNVLSSRLKYSDIKFNFDMLTVYIDKNDRNCRRVHEHSTSATTNGEHFRRRECVIKSLNIVISGTKLLQMLFKNLT